MDFNKPSTQFTEIHSFLNMLKAINENSKCCIKLQARNEDDFKILSPFPFLLANDFTMKKTMKKIDGINKGIYVRAEKSIFLL